MPKLQNKNEGNWNTVLRQRREQITEIWEGKAKDGGGLRSVQPIFSPFLLRRLSSCLSKPDWGREMFFSEPRERLFISREEEKERRAPNSERTTLSKGILFPRVSFSPL